MTVRPAAFLAALLLPAAATAETSLEGRFSGGLAADGDATAPYLAADLTARLAFGDGIAAEVGVYGAFSTAASAHETYAALGFAVAGGTLGVGVTRPAFDLFAPSRLDAAFPLAAVERARRLRSRATLGAMELTEVPVGVTFAGEDAAISLNAATKNGGPVVLGAGGRSRVGDLGVAGAIEVADDGDAAVGAKIGADYAAKGWDLGALASLPAVDIRDGMIEVGAGRAIGRKTRLTAIVAAGRHDSFVGIAAERRIGDAGSLRAGIGADGGDPTADVALDLRF